MDDQIQFLARYVAEIIIGVSSFFMVVFRYREVIKFFLRVCQVLYKPLVGLANYIMLPHKLSKQQTINAENLTKLEKTLADLSVFVKDKLSYNSGSSLVDAIKRIETRQIIQEHAHNTFAQDAEQGIFRCDLQGKNIWVNRTYARFLGCGTNELLGLSWKKFIKTPELTRYNGVWQTAFADGCEFEDVVEFTDINNHLVRLKISVSAIPDEKGGAIGYVGQVTAL